MTILQLYNENKHPISKKIKSCQRLSLFENFSKYLANNVCFQILPLGFFFYGYCYFINFNEKNLRDGHISSLFCKCWYTSTNIYLIHNCLQQCSGTCNSRFTVRKMLFFKQQFFSLVLFLFYVHICQVNTCMNRIDVTEM